MALSVIYWATYGVTEQKYSARPLLHLGMDDASQCFNDPTPPLLHLVTLPWALPPTSAYVSVGSVKFLPAASALHRPILVLISF